MKLATGPLSPLKGNQHKFDIYSTGAELVPNELYMVQEYEMIFT